MSETIQLFPATGWCYFHFNDAQTAVAIYDVALWKVLPNGPIVGLISAGIAKTRENISCLTTPPSVGGKYFLKGSADDPREWPNPPQILASWPDEFGQKTDD